MSIGIRSYPPEQRAAVAHRRSNSGAQGLGYWGARDALAKIAKTAVKVEPSKGL